MLLNEIKHLLEPQTQRNTAISSMIQLLLALRFYATGSFLITMGDFVGVSPMSAFCMVHRASEAIASLCSEFIKLPTTPQIEAELFNISIHSLTVRKNLLYYNGAFGNVFILGDSAYPNGPYLMTPLTAPVTPVQHLFNEAFIRTRNIVEHTFGVWSRKFAVLHIGSRFHKVGRTLHMIIATAVLHNIARKVQPAPQINPNIYNAIPQLQNFRPPVGADVRQYLIDTYLQR
ncbi:putative nuclease HARBI1 [Chelonus insularis]|uniref:putative nuclease HARBI1 n=1 Tax=Chelonus insularis TaxID=460826 RepID=UPI00158DB818|nr:putative nuclease HARBI1 [Chelonus insularis]